MRVHVKEISFQHDSRQGSVLLPLCLWRNSKFPLKMVGTREGTEGSGETKQRGRKRLVIGETSGLWSVNKAVQQGNKAGVWSCDITDWLAPLSGSVRAAEQDSGWEGTRGAGVGFSGGLSVSCQFVWDLLSTHSIYSHTFTAPVRFCSPRTRLFVSRTSFSIIFYLVSLWFFLFAVSFFLFSSDHHHYAPSSSLLSTCRPSLLPSILQMLVGSRTISRGSWWPTAPSLWSLPAIVPGLTAAWLLHSINRIHAGLITTAHCSALASIIGETLETWVHAWKQDTLGNLWLIPQRYLIIVHEWLDLLNLHLNDSQNM